MHRLLLALALLAAPLTLADDFALSPFCPPALRADTQGLCRLHTPYQDYGSLYAKGVGGLKTGLPPVRDGFSPQQIDLGRLLFFDPLLSGDNTVACATCHDPALGFSDGKARSVGIAGTEVQRSAPSLWNVAFLQRLLWDGSKPTLEAQLQGP
ncbi:MAG: cytochrome-c peroxidase, partial [Cellvibrionales bacterium]